MRPVATSCVTHTSLDRCPQRRERSSDTRNGIDTASIGSRAQSRRGHKAMRTITLSPDLTISFQERGLGRHRGAGDGKGGENAGRNGDRGTEEGIGVDQYRTLRWTSSHTRYRNEGDRNGIRTILGQKHKRQVYGKESSAGDLPQRKGRTAGRTNRNAVADRTRSYRSSTEL